MAPKTEAAKQLAKQWEQKNKKNMAVITEAAANNFELQLLLIGEINNYKDLQQQASTEGKTVAEAVAATKAAPKENVADWNLPVTGTLDRHLWNYKRWGPQLIKLVVLKSDERLRGFGAVRQ